MISDETSPTVLLVEGDIVIRHPLAEYLRECGFRVFEASTGEEARAALAAPGIIAGIVIIDMETPGAGFPLCQWIKEHHAEIEVVLAGSVEKAVASAAEVCHDGPALAKPYAHHLVLQRIREMLARRRH